MEGLKLEGMERRKMPEKTRLAEASQEEVALCVVDLTAG